jgi:hypothetical protein
MKSADLLLVTSIAWFLLLLAVFVWIAVAA